MRISSITGDVRILLVRHGITESNNQLRFSGHLDIPMNEFGQQQVSSLANRLASERIDFVYTSDLKRARETAAKINKFHNRNVITEPGLRELDFGEWAGKTYEEIHRDDPERLNAWEADRCNTPVPGGESLMNLYGRATQLLEYYKEKHFNETVLLCAHGGTLQVIICHALGLRLENYWRLEISPASLSVLRIYEGEAVLNLLNDTNHLDN